MYRRRRSPSILIIIILGVISGVVFLLVDQSRPSESTATSQPTVTDAVLDVPDEDRTPTPVFSGSLSVTPSPSPIVVDAQPDIADAELLIPNAGVVAPIIRVYMGESTWDVSNLGNNIGHLQGTQWLPDNGNVVLSGHVELSDGRQGIFANLKELQQGDRITIRYNDLEYHYNVTTITSHQPTDLTPIFPTDDNRLTLITCDGYDFVSDRYLNRIVVVAEQVVIQES